MRKREGRRFRLKPYAVERIRSLSLARGRNKLTDLRGSEIDRWSTRAASWAQVAMLGLLTFGYFYTVRPVYQKDLLEEQSARLQIEKAQIEQANRKSQEQANKLRRDLVNLKERRAALARANAQLVDQQRSLDQEVSQLKLETVGLNEKLNSLSTISSAQEMQILEGQRALFSNLVSLYWLPEILNSEDRFIFLSADESKVENWSRSTSPQPYQVILESIDREIASRNYFGLPEPHGVSQQLLREFRADVVKHQNELTCPTPDRRNWLEAWLKTHQLYMAMVPDCVNMHVAHTAKKEGWDAATAAQWRRGRQGKQFETVYTSGCESMAEYHANDRFNDAWQAFYQVCTRRLIYADSIASGDTKNLDPFPATTPPRPDANWYESWYESDQ